VVAAIHGAVSIRSELTPLSTLRRRMSFLTIRDHEVEHLFARRRESCKTFLTIVDYDRAKEIVDFQRRVL
jgi:hypothetical protein